MRFLIDTVLGSDVDSHGKGLAFEVFCLQLWIFPPSEVGSSFLQVVFSMCVGRCRQVVPVRAWFLFVVYGKELLALVFLALLSVAVLLVLLVHAETSVEFEIGAVGM